MLRAVLLACVIAVGVLVLGQAAAEQNAVQQKHSKPSQPNQRPTLDTSSLEKAIRESVKQATEKPDPNAEEKLQIDRQIEEYTGKLAEYTSSLSNYTLALFIATGILAAIGVWQGSQLKKTVNAMEREFIASHPPRIILRTISLEDTGGDPANYPPKPGLVRYLIVNVGGSTAKIYCRNITPIILDIVVGESSIKKLPAWPEYDGAENDTRAVDLESGDMDAMQDIFIKDREDWLKLETGRADAYLIGFIAYTDATGIKRFKTGFARRRNKITGRYEPIDDSDYEYQQ